jgi:hypothetical protein
MPEYTTTDEGRITRVFALDPAPPPVAEPGPRLGFMGDGGQAAGASVERVIERVQPPDGRFRHAPRKEPWTQHQAPAPV